MPISAGNVPGQVYTLAVTSDPSVSPGVAADVGVYATDGTNYWVKSGTANTAWMAVNGRMRTTAAGGETSLAVSSIPTAHNGILLVRYNYKHNSAAAAAGSITFTSSTNNVFYEGWYQYAASGLGQWSAKDATTLPCGNTSSAVTIFDGQLQFSKGAFSWNYVHHWSFGTGATAWNYGYGGHGTVAHASDITTFTLSLSASAFAANSFMEVILL